MNILSKLFMISMLAMQGVFNPPPFDPKTGDVACKSLGIMRDFMFSDIMSNSNKYEDAITSRQGRDLALNIAQGLKVCQFRKFVIGSYFQDPDMYQTRVLTEGDKSLIAIVRKVTFSFIQFFKKQ
jgi:hypothetical protein